jgi:hypothetical protein
MPYTWNSTFAPKMCSCPVNPRYDLAWECPRCKKVNAPWKGSCDCTPTPFGAPKCDSTQPYIGRANPFLGYFPDTNNCDSLNKNFTDK